MKTTNTLRPIRPINPYRPAEPRSPWEPAWFPPTTQVSGKFQLPVIQPIDIEIRPSGMTSFKRPAPCQDRQSTILHGFLDDTSLQPLLRNPARYLQQFAEYTAIVTPDFSLYTEMPLQDRIRSVWSSRLVGAYFQHHGIKVIPNVRWAHLADIDFVLDGLPSANPIVISSQNLCNRNHLWKTFVTGVKIILETLQPSHVIAYGELTVDLRSAINEKSVLWRYPTDVARVMKQGTR